MKVLYSTQAVVEFDGTYYYSNSVNSTYKRYLSLGDEIIVMSYLKRVSSSKHDRIESDAIKFVFIEKENSLKKLISYSKRNKKVVKLSVDGVDYCVAHVPCPHSIQVINYSRKIDKPCLTVVCGCPFDAYWNFSWKGKIIAPFAYLRLRNAQKNVDYSIYVTKNFLEGRYPNKGHHIGCSNVNISTGIDGVLEKRLSTIDELSHTNRKVRIGTLGAVDVYYKGQEFIIKALQILRKQGVEYEYWIVGGGDSSRLNGIAKECNVDDLVRFTGPLPHDKVLELIDNIDIYAQPSLTEGLPRSVIEAMSRGCLTMGTKVGGIPELVNPEYLFKKGDVYTIASILQHITIDDLKLQAEKNYIAAKDYDVNELNNRRQEFIMSFKEKYT